MKSIKLLIIGLLFTSTVTSLLAQHDGYGWRVGVGTGSMSYFGDISPSVRESVKAHYKLDNYKFTDGNYDDWGVWLERKISSGTSFVINANTGTITGNDRDYIDSDYFQRSLNFETNITDLSATFVFRADNDRILASSSILSPYVFVGLGRTWFDVYGDLANDKDLYDYGMPDLEQDGDFETNLTDLEVETDYNTSAWNIPFGLGLRLKLARSFSLHLQTDVKYMLNSDYIDDVGGDYRPDFVSSLQEYASNPNSNYQADMRGTDRSPVNDFYAFTSLSLRFNFGKPQAKKFVPPSFFPTEEAPLDLSLASSATEVEKKDRKNKKAAKEENTAIATEAETTETEELTAEEIEAIIDQKMAEMEQSEEETKKELDKKTPAKEIEVEVEEEIEVEQRMPAGGMQSGMQQQGTMQGGYTNGSLYDPTVEMLKLEVDRLRAENTDLKNGERFKDLERKIKRLEKSLGAGGRDTYDSYDDDDDRRSYEDKMDRPSRGGKGGKKNGSKSDEEAGSEDMEEGADAESEEEEEEELDWENMTKKERKQAEKEAKKAEKENKEDDKEKSDVDSEEEEEEKGFFGKWKDKRAEKKAEKKAEKSEDGDTANKKEEDTEDKEVTVEIYEFAFEGSDVKDNVEDNRKLKKQLNKIAKKARKDDNAKVIIEARYTAKSKDDVNKMANAIGLLLTDEFDLSAGQISYELSKAKKGELPENALKIFNLKLIK